MKFLLVLAVLACSFGQSSGCNGAGEPEVLWLQDGYDAAATGQSPFAGPQVGRIKWQVLLDGWGCSPVIGTDGRVYVGSQHGTLYAVGKDGTVKWKRQWPIPGVKRRPKLFAKEQAEHEALGHIYCGHIVSCAVGTDNTVYVARSLDGIVDESRPLVALTADGKEKWHYPVGPENINTKLTLGPDGTIYFGTSGARPAYHAVNPDGTQKWRKVFGKPDEVCGSAALGKNGLIYVAGDRLWALDAATGNVKHQYPNRIDAAGGLYGPAVASDGTVYVPSGIRSRAGHNFCAFLPDLTLKWAINAGVMELTPAVAVDGTAYIHTWGDLLKKTDGKADVPPGLHAINPDGSVKWSIPHLMKAPPEALDDNPGGGDMGSDSSPIIGSNGIVYFGSDIGRIFAVKPNGKVLWKINLGGEFDTRPAIDDEGTLYVCHAGGPGDKRDLQPRCYAVSNTGVSVEELERKRRDRFQGLSRLERLRVELEDARRAGNMVEIREIETLIRKSTDEDTADDREDH